MEQKEILELLLFPVVFGFCYAIARRSQQHEKKNYYALHNFGNTTQATVSEVAHFMKGKRSSGFFGVTIDYLFKDETGKEFKGFGTFSDEKFPGGLDEIKKGDSITVYYLSKDPNVNALEEIVLRAVLPTS